jgi:hypothetical protein
LGKFQGKKRKCVDLSSLSRLHNQQLAKRGTRKPCFMVFEPKSQEESERSFDSLQQTLILGQTNRIKDSWKKVQSFFRT